MKAFLLPFLLNILLTPQACLADDIRFLETPQKSIAARFESIQQAKEKIIIEAFYWENDKLGNALLATLVQKKKINPEISIKILLDDFGSASMSKSKLCFAKASGISIRFFNPIKKSQPRLAQRRDHRKIWMTEKTFFLGGRNLSDENFDAHKWDLDAQFSIDQLPKVEKTINVMWNQSIDLNCHNNALESPTFELKNHEYSKEHLASASWYPVNAELTFDYGLDDKITYQKFINQIQAARESLTIESGYFTPNQAVLNLLKLHSQIGTQINITTNSPFFEYWMGTLSTCAAIKYQKQLINQPGVKLNHPLNPYSTHSKILYTDGDLFSFGSFNVHEKSFSWNAETWVTISHMPNELKNEINTILAKRKSHSQIIKTAKDFNLQTQTIKNQMKCATYEMLAPLLRPFI